MLRLLILSFCVGAIFCQDDLDDHDHAHCPDDDLICSEDAKCVFIDNKFACECEQGFVGNGTHCYDINECIGGVDSCDNDAECYNLPGSFKCVCRKGFSGNGFRCDDIDECAAGTVKCAANAQCYNEIGFYRCQCDAQYTGDGDIYCRKMTKCDLCGANEICATLSDGEKACICKPGYTKSPAGCLDVDECANGVDCGPNAFCVNTPGAYNCTCKTGYSGPKCDKATDVCASGKHNCHADAKCITHVGGSHLCQCKAGFTGDGTICTDVDECVDPILSGCSGNAMCTNTRGSYTCTCNKDHAGDGYDCLHLDFIKSVLG